MKVDEQAFSFFRRLDDAVAEAFRTAQDNVVLTRPQFDHLLGLAILGYATTSQREPRLKRLRVAWRGHL